MKTKSLIALAFFTGMTLGAATIAVVQPANASQPVWQDVAKDPAFRNAVIEVVSSCIIQNSIIYCE